MLSSGRLQNNDDMTLLDSLDPVLLTVAELLKVLNQSPR